MLRRHRRRAARTPHARSLPQLRAPGCALRRGRDRAARSKRTGEDEPARGDLPASHDQVVAHALRCRPHYVGANGSVCPHTLRTHHGARGARQGARRPGDRGGAGRERRAAAGYRRSRRAGSDGPDRAQALQGQWRAAARRRGAGTGQRRALCAHRRRHRRRLTDAAPALPRRDPVPGAPLVLPRLATLQQSALAAQQPAAPDPRAPPAGRDPALLERAAGGAWHGRRDAAGVRGTFEAELAAQHARELAAGVSLVGPHRDDLGFAVGGVDVTLFGSRGQQRSVALAIKLAELAYIRREAGEWPILLLDDATSELDAMRRAAVLELAREHQQVFLTTAEPDSIA